MDEDAHDRPAPATPRPASTVVLVRDRRGGGIEVFLVQRPASMGFMGGMHVFPGGKLCAADASEPVRARIADLETQAARHAVWGEGVSANEAIARAVAAVRETFEEAGVLLCAARAGEDADELARLRAALLEGADFGDLLARNAFHLVLAGLQPLARWITPEREPIRFDTSFYVARAPDGQQAAHDGRESVDGGWFAPAEALAAADEGRVRLAPPTALTLESLRHAASAEAAIAIAARRPPPVILPILRSSGADVEVLYPGDPEHPVPARAFDGPTRRLLRR